MPPTLGPPGIGVGGRDPARNGDCTDARDDSARPPPRRETVYWRDGHGCRVAGGCAVACRRAS